MLAYSCRLLLRGFPDHALKLILELTQFCPIGLDLSKKCLVAAIGFGFDDRESINDNFPQFKYCLRCCDRILRIDSPAGFERFAGSSKLIRAPSNFQVI